MLIMTQSGGQVVNVDNFDLIDFGARIFEHLKSTDEKKRALNDMFAMYGRGARIYRIEKEYPAE